MVKKKEEELKPTFSVGELSKRSGLAVSAIHFYERKNLIQSHRNGANHRRYTRTTLRVLSVIRFAQNLGISLKEIQSVFASLSKQNKITQEDWERVSQDWQDQLNERIKKLMLLRDELSGCIGCGCLSMDKCRVINPYDILGEEGQGARKLEQD